jgi:hypothetical protein
VEKIMPKTLINCPKCKQPVQAEIRQLFDMNEDPTAKQMLLSGAVNLIQCPLCGFNGNLATPIVYHDPEKELLLTFIPPEIGLPQNEQEKIIGSNINQIINKLPQEKRKAYLLQPQASLTFQGMIERILEKDGITREMIQAQQQRLNIIQQLLSASKDARSEIVKQEQKLFDAQLFGILDRLVQTAAAGNDQQAVEQLTDIQKFLMETTEFGKQVSKQVEEVQAAVESLKAVEKDLTREKLLDIVIKAPNETRLRALVSLTRPGMDYQFFQLLSEHIDRARGDGRNRLVSLREQLLNITSELDKQVENRIYLARELLNKILSEENISEAAIKNLPGIDEYFLQELNLAMSEAKKLQDKTKEEKLELVINTIHQASTASQAIAFIEALVEAPDEGSRIKIIEENKDLINQEFMNTLSSIVYQVQSGDDQGAAEEFRDIHRLILRYSMQKNLGATS